MKPSSKHLGSTVREATSVPATDTKHTKKSIRVNYKMEKLREIQYKILNEENRNFGR